LERHARDPSTGATLEDLKDEARAALRRLKALEDHDAVAYVPLGSEIVRRLERLSVQNGSG